MTNVGRRMCAVTATLMLSLATTNVALAEGTLALDAGCPNAEVLHVLSDTGATISPAVPQGMAADEVRSATKALSNGKTSDVPGRLDWSQAKRLSPDDEPCALEGGTYLVRTNGDEVAVLVDDGDDETWRGSVLSPICEAGISDEDTWVAAGEGRVTQIRVHGVSRSSSVLVRVSPADGVSLDLAKATSNASSTKATDEFGLTCAGMSSDTLTIEVPTTIDPMSHGMSTVTVNAMVTRAGTPVQASPGSVSLGTVSLSCDVTDDEGLPVEDSRMTVSLDGAWWDGESFSASDESEALAIATAPDGTCTLPSVAPGKVVVKNYPPEGLVTVGPAEDSLEIVADGGAVNVRHAGPSQVENAAQLGFSMSMHVATPIAAALSSARDVAAKLAAEAPWVFALPPLAVIIVVIGIVVHARGKDDDGYYYD